jgi:SAM-dependent methyltransferase
MIPDLRAYYLERYAAFDHSLTAVQHESKEGQEGRFQLLSKQISPDSMVVDVGCGFGDLLPFLRRQGFKGRYVGLDFVDEFIEVARNAQPDSMARFEVFDILGPDPLPACDVAVQSGIFNNAMPEGDNQRLLETTLIKMAGACRDGFAFNALSTLVDFRDPALHYFDPGEVVTLCRNLTPFVSMRHDYVLREGGYPYEFTVYAQMTPVPLS